MEFIRILIVEDEGIVATDIQERLTAMGTDREKSLQLQAEGESSPLYTLPNLDIGYLMKSSLDISAEIEQDALLKKIMQVVIESSGAQHGFLLVTGDNGALFVCVECHAAEQQTVVMQHRELEEAEEIGKAIVRYVYRTGEKVILQDAAHQGIFKDNSEVHEMQLRSVLCLPVIKQSRMIGCCIWKIGCQAAYFPRNGPK